MNNITQYRKKKDNVIFYRTILLMIDKYYEV